MNENEVDPSGSMVGEPARHDDADVLVVRPGRHRTAAGRSIVESRDEGPDVQYLQPSTALQDWHDAREGEPYCGRLQWRCRRREWVVDISRMTSSHLQGALWYARKFIQHRSRLQVLELEAGRRLQGPAQELALVECRTP